MVVAKIATHKQVIWRYAHQGNSRHDGGIGMKCIDCEHFNIQCEYESEYNWGLAECKKYNLVTDFRSHSKLKKLTCVVIKGKSEKEDGK